MSNVITEIERSSLQATLGPNWAPELYPGSFTLLTSGAYLHNAALNGHLWYGDSEVNVRVPGSSPSAFVASKLTLSTHLDTRLGTRVSMPGAKWGAELGYVLSQMYRDANWTDTYMPTHAEAELAISRAHSVDVIAGVKALRNGSSTFLMGLLTFDDGSQPGSSSLGNSREASMGAVFRGENMPSNWSNVSLDGSGADGALPLAFARNRQPIPFDIKETVDLKTIASPAGLLDQTIVFAAFFGEEPQVDRSQTIDLSKLFSSSAPNSGPFGEGILLGDTARKAGSAGPLPYTLLLFVNATVLPSTSSIFVSKTA